MPNERIIPYNIAQPLIKEGDVLLFRSGKSWVSYFISQGSLGMHSHVAMASWHGNLLECVEFREGSLLSNFIAVSDTARGGGRTVNLETQVDKYPNSIDVFRPKPSFSIANTEYNSEEPVFTVSYDEVTYSGIEATEKMREMTGLPYGWKRIWILAQYHLPILRWRTKPVFDDKAINGNVYPVCSTAVAVSVRMGGYDGKADLRPLKADPYMTPSDIASSPLLDYVFTLGVSDDTK